MAKMIEFPIIDMEATGRNIRQLRLERGLTVREVQEFFGFEEPGAIYQWQRGHNLPTVDNLCALSRLFGVLMDDIIVLRAPTDTNCRKRIAAGERHARDVKKLIFLLTA